MSAEILRKAAALMRERAEAASAAPWTATTFHGGRPGVYSEPIAETNEFDPEVATVLDAEDGEHIASWHPAVALAVAAWLDSVADAYEPPDGDYRSHKGRSIASVDEAKAIAIARAYLEESA